MLKFSAALMGLSLLAGPAFAQDRHGAMFERMCRDSDARIASRLAYVEAKIQPTPNQRVAWDSFARDARAAAEPLKRVCTNPPADAPANDAAASLVRRETVMAAMLDSMKAFRPAIERLQAALDDSQKTLLAQALERGGHGGGRRRH
jgi:hypothetical protein